MNEIEVNIFGQFLAGNRLDKINLLEQGDFEVHPELFKAIQELHRANKEINILTVSRKTHYSLVELGTIISQCMPSLFDSCFKDLIKARIERKAQILLLNPAKDTREKLYDILKDYESLVDGSAEEIPVNMGIEYMQELDRRAKEKETLLSGIPTLDLYTGGFHKQEFTVLGARPGVGKSALGLQMAQQISNRGYPVLLISLEMARTQITERIMCQETNIPHERLKSGKITDEDYKTISVASDFIPKKLIVLDSTYTLEGIKTAVDRFKPLVLIVDYIGLVKASGRFNSKREEMSHVTRSLKMLAMEKKIAVIGLAQLNRNAQARFPQLSELKESGSLEEDADNVIFVHNLTDEDIPNGDFPQELGSYLDKGMKPSLVILAKQRNGAVGSIPVVFRGNKFNFQEV